MHCTTPAVCLLWGVWDIDCKCSRPECGWQGGAAIPLSQVHVHVSHCLWYWESQSIVIVVVVIVCDKGGVVLRVVDLPNSVGVLEWVLKVFPRERVCDLSGSDVVLFEYGLRKEGVELYECVCLSSSVQYCLLEC